ncbi:MAG: tRNA dihydrouridine synthase DusB [Geobacteraceae bacterium]|nr:tRNA dihydrouridine synthase DusB [Geobacteraceae bacterium]
MLSRLAIGSLEISPPLLLAPMAGITDLPFRSLAREYGAPLCFTEMVSAQGLIRDGKNTVTLLRSNAGDRPLGIQLFGEDPEALAEAARRVEHLCDVVDINMGCPVKKVVSGGSGSALLRKPEAVAAILRAVRKAIRIPLTIKIRTGWNSGETSFLEISRIAELEGCDAITFHPRTRTQMFSEHADWDKLRELKRASRIPIIGSGDIFSSRDIIAMFEKTGCDGVMVARGSLGNPWIFREAADIMGGGKPHAPTRAERHSTVLKHLDSLRELYGEQTAVREMRKHLSWYVKGLAGAARFRSLCNTIGEIKELREAVDAFFIGMDDENV